MGRPRGTTNDNKISFQNVRAAAVTKLTMSLKQKMTDLCMARGPKARLRGDDWNDLCSSVAIEFQVPKPFLIAKRKTCYSRISRDNHAGIKTRSPVAAIEPIIVDILTQKARMRQPVTAGDAIAFANSLLDGSGTLEDLKDFHVTCGRSITDIGALGNTWWRNFLKRHPALRSSKPVPFPNRRMTWSTYENFKIMYEDTYAIWERCGVAERLDAPAFIDRDGRVMSDEEGRQKNMLRSTYRLLHPDGALNADEIGHNTNTTKDKLQRNEKRIHLKGERAQKIASETDVAWTMLAVTALTGHPVCCVVIMEGKRLAPEDLTGEDIMASNDVDDVASWLDKTNHGPGKRFPGGPTCEFRGKVIPAFVTFSDSGGVTSQILKDVLKHIDKCGVYRRGDTDNFEPTIQLDGHHTRFGLDFVEYCRRPENKWNVSIGCPESTHLWQIQDSSEMNGQNKLWTYHYKDKLLAFKRRMNLPLAIRRPDIIPIVNRAWKRSFAVVETNRSAIEERGWNPPNMALLHHPDILPTKPPPPLTSNNRTTPIDLVESEGGESVSVTSEDKQRTAGISVNVLEDLNYNSGFAGEVITDIVMWAKDNDRLKENVKKRVEDRKSFHDKAKEAKRLSPGFFFTNRKLAVTSDEVYLAIKGRSDARLDKEKVAVRKALKDRVKMEELVRSILSDAKRYILAKPEQFPDGAPQDRNLNFEEIPASFLSGTTTKTLLRFMTMKKKGDKGFSKLNTAEAKAMWKEICMRTPHSAKEYLMEEKGYSEALVEAVMAEPRTTAVALEPDARERQEEPPTQVMVQAEAPQHNREEEDDMEGGVSI